MVFQICAVNTPQLAAEILYKNISLKINIMIKNDCKYFLGDRPCQPHKTHGVHCDSCEFFKAIGERILIIKLGAAGDVIRTTPLLHQLKKIYPSSYITWVTDYPELLPVHVDEKIKFSERTIGWITARTFDLCYNLDKDREAISIMERLLCEQKYGFGMDKYGRACALNQQALPKLLTGVFNDVSKQNKKSYPQETFEMCGFNFQGEKYILENYANRNWGLNHSRRIVGFNTGCGSRWPSRLWPMEYWLELAQLAKEEDLEIVWLGGPEEHERNTELSKQGGGQYFGVFPLKEYINLVGNCDLIVTQVTMTLHIALGLEKKVVLLNNIFNRNEFELYNLGVIIEPEVMCECYYSPVCPHESMKKISSHAVMQAIIQLLKEN